MLEGVPDLTLAQLNEATLAWLEIEYQRRPHRELGQRTPLQCFLEGRDVGRPTPSGDALREAFTAEITRSQRRSDGTRASWGAASKSLPATVTSPASTSVTPPGT
ncbi:MAG: hypothetical protein H6827_10110 [Planctomycetes bacterium]|nr:hypothetical protein [Planctomycetota bacterium]